MTTTKTALLPHEFADLEPLAQIWALPDANLRYQRRVQSTMEELQYFYDTVMPRGEEILSYLDQFEMDDLPETALNLGRLLSSLSFASFAVEIFKQPTVPDCGATYVVWTKDPVGL